MSEVAFLPHLADLERLMTWLSEGECCSVIALSNMGKSTLVRRACDPTIQRRFLGARATEFAFFYVDCNTMLTLSEQGFYEAALRNVLAEIKRLGAADALVEHLRDLYHKVVEPSSPFLVPLSFNEAMVALSEKLGRRVVFLFDEFDDPFDRLDGRVFLNLRALRDKYGKDLCFVTASGQELCNQRQDVEASEFCELFTEYVIYLAGLNPDEARHVVKSIARAEDIELERDETEFVIQQAGGHVGLLQAATAVLMRVAAGAPANLRERSLTMVRQQLDSDGPVRAECAKLWEQLTSEEQSALLRFLAGGQTLPLDPEMLTLVRKGIITGGESPAVFGELFAGYARRQRLVRQPMRSGVYVDVDSGDVSVDGKPVSVLTDHEYRLLLLLYGRINKIVTRDDVAESVWGADYMENIDDARCDKLLSRLRAKIEPDPANPKYLQTVRGRGYKLVSG